ncbi:MAG: His/Gly/Thr/Pro-type tRNA ligase C-terminal domain-containing protein, partial [Alphaproteobacteria bacterium]
RFPGAIETYTVEAFMQDGKALQAATSHNLGQTFAHSSDIKYLASDGVLKHAWTTSWGMSTRTIGGLIMVHGDDDGMVMPPRIAPHQVVILPFIKDDADKAKILEFCEKVQKDLRAKDISVQVDKSDARSSDKMWAAIKKGVPIRLEIGAREIEEGQLVFTRRDLGKDGKVKVSVADCAAKIAEALEAMQKDLLAKARERMAGMVKEVKTLKEVRDFFATEQQGGVKIDYSLLKDSSEWAAIKGEFAVTTRCLPFADGGTKVILAKAY